ncbi:MAG: LamG domain-containing protein [Phycisphaeraceae bacterium]
MAQYELNEIINPSAGTTVADTSGNGFNGTYQGAGGATNGPLVGVAGAIGTAADFDGTDDTVNLGNPAALNLTNNFTISAWIRSDAIGGVQRVFSKQPAGGYGFGLSGNQLRLTTYGVLDYNTTAAGIEQGKLTHIAVTFDSGNDATFFINGQQRQVITGVNPATINANNFFIGSAGASEFFNGVIDHVQVHNTVLSASQIQAAAGISGPQLIGHWKLDEISGTFAADSSGRGHNGTYQGGATLNQPGLHFYTGTSVDFDGSNDEVFLSNPAEFRLANNFTIAAWIRPDSVSGFQRIFSQNPGGGFGFGLNGDELRFTTFGVLDYDTTGVDLVAGETHHVAVVFDLLNDAHFYVDGVFVQTIAGLNPAGIGTNNWFIGSTGVSERFNGLIDDVRFYNGALTADEIRQAAILVPEPATLTLSLLALGGMMRRRRRTA